jgi:hypothetical protein
MKRKRYFLWHVFRVGGGPLLWLRVGRGIERRGLGVELIFDTASTVGRILLLGEEGQARYGDRINSVPIEGGKK